MNKLRQKFEEQGFLLLPKQFEAVNLGKMVETIEQILKEANHSDIQYNENKIPYKLTHLFEKGDCFLQFLTDPQIFGIVQILSPAPDEIVPTWEDLLIKYPKNGIAVGVHQDMGMCKMNTNTVFSTAIYLNNSENPVYFLPGSHKLGPLTFQEIKEIWQKRKSEFMPIKANTGDVLVHNAHILHYSPPNNSRLKRYTWYIEFRTVSDLISDSPWDKDWIALRRCLLLHSINSRKQAGLPTPNYEFKDIELLKNYQKNYILKIRHQTATAKFDLDSPYFHFAETLYE